MPNSYQGTYNHTQNTHSQDQYFSQDNQGRSGKNPNGTEHETNMVEKNVLNNLEELVGVEDNTNAYNQSIFSNNMFA